jgi:DNA-binding response OmpR family regulator
MTEVQRILAVNRTPHNLLLLEQVLGDVGYTTLKATGLEEFDEALSHPAGLALALVDITGFDAAIWERCERLREEEIPLVLVAPRQSAAVEEIGEQHGASNVLVKPLAIRQLVSLVDLLVRE